MPLPLLLAALVPAASAATCDAQLAKIQSLSGSGVAAAFTETAKCDKKVAEVNFVRYLEKATDSDAVTALFLAAIDVEVWNPVWTALSKITSYEARDEVSSRVGEACAADPKVVKFLQGAYFGLRDIEFQQWNDAYATCDAADLWTWMDGQIQAPPAKMFDEKFNALMDIYVRKKRVDALPGLMAGAVKAAGNNGPFDQMLAKMGEAVAPELGSRINPEDQKKLEEAMVQVAKQVPVEKTRGVADQLALAGAEDAAAQLLPTIYADRVQSGGGFVWGAAAAEAGECGGKKTAVLHYAVVTEPGKRWSLQRDLETPMRAFKPKLGKDCKLAEGPWPVIPSSEPLKTAKEVDEWSKKVVAQWEKDGFAVKAQKEKEVALP